MYNCKIVLNKYKGRKTKYNRLLENVKKSS